MSYKLDEVYIHPKLVSMLGAPPPILLFIKKRLHIYPSLQEFINHQKKRVAVLEEAKRAISRAILNREQYDRLHKKLSDNNKAVADNQMRLKRARTAESAHQQNIAFRNAVISYVSTFDEEAWEEFKKTILE